MKLLAELFDLHRSLNEETIEVKPASDVWDENKDNIVQYVSSVVYLARPSKDDETKIEVFVEKGDIKKPYANLDEDDFDEAFVVISKTAKPDVEGFTKYRDASTVEGFMYDGDTVKIDGDDGESPQKITMGDYLLRTDDGDNFKYFVEPAKDFEDEYIEK